MPPLGNRPRLAAGLLGLLCLPCVAGRSASGAPEGEPPPDVVVAVTGERIPCTVVGSAPGTVHVRIGARIYAFDRAALAAVERGGLPDLDPAVVDLVEALAPRLGDGNPLVARAAEAGLSALGEAGRPYLEAVQQDLPPAARAALGRLLAPAREAPR